MAFTIFAVAILILAVFVILSANKIVPRGREYSVQRFGRHTRTLKPGIAIPAPFVETIGRKAGMMEQVLDMPRQEVITKDNVTVQVAAIVAGLAELLNGTRRDVAAPSRPTPDRAP